MKNLTFEIIDSSKRKARPCALLILDDEGCWRIEIDPHVDVRNVPALFIPFVEKGQFVIEDEWARRWVQERIVPSSRHNIGEVLNAHKLLEYDEAALLRSSKGQSSQDDYVVVELDSDDDAATPAVHRENVRKIIGTNIRRQRKLLGLTQSDLAKRLGIHQSALSNVESGKTNLTLDLLTDISSGLQTNVDTLLQQKDEVLWNEDRIRMKTLLMERSEELGQIYTRLVDELETYSIDNQTALADSAMVAHCFRELVNAFPSFLVKDKLKNGKQKEEAEALSYVQELIASLPERPEDEKQAYELVPHEIVDALRHYREAREAGTKNREAKDYLVLYGGKGSIGSAAGPWGQVRKIAGRAHLQRSSDPNPLNPAQCILALENLEASIEARLGSLLNSVERMERTLRLANSVNAQGAYERPQVSEVMRALALLGDNSLEWRFYSELKNPLWFEVLNENEIFEKCLVSQLNDGSANDFLPAPYFRYCASNQPELVVQFIERHADSANHYFRILTRDLAKDLPGEFACRIACVLIQWLNDGYGLDSFFWTASELQPLVQNLLLSDKKRERKAGASLFSALTKFHEKDGWDYDYVGKPALNEYEYSGFVLNILSNMSLPKRYNEARNRIDEFLEIETAQRKGEVSSVSIMPDLTPAESSYEIMHDPQIYVWIDELKKAIVEQLGQDADVVLDWLDRASSVVRRIAFLALAEYLEEFRDDVKHHQALLLAKNMLNSDSLYELEFKTEAGILLDVVSGFLDKEYITLFLSRHHERLLKQKRLFRGRRLQFGDTGANAEKIALRQLNMSNWHILSRFDEKTLPRIWRRELLALERWREECVQLTCFIEDGVVAGPNSPANVSTLLRIGPENVIKYLENWVPSESDERRLIEPEGFALELRAMIKENPEFFSGYYENLVLMKSVYLAGILEGLTEAIRDGSKFPYREILDFCQLLLSGQMRDMKDKASRNRVRTSIARLIETVLEKGEYVSVEQQMRDILDLLMLLSQIDEDDRDYESILANNEDPLMASWNMVRPTALASLGRWMASVQQPSDEDALKVYGALDTALPTRAENRAEIAAVARAIGFLVDMDSRWPKENYGELFGNVSPDMNQRLLLSLIIDLYIPNKRMFDFLEPAILLSFDTDLEGYSSGGRIRKGVPYIQKVGVWIYSLIANGGITVEDEIFLRWFDKVDEQVRGKVLNSLCSQLKRASNAPSYVVDNVKNLWELHASERDMSPKSVRGARHLLACHSLDEGWLRSALLEEVRLGNLNDHWVLYQDDLIRFMLTDSLWGIAFLQSFLAHCDDRHLLHKLDGFVPELIQDYVKNGNSTDVPVFLDCLDRLARLGMIDVGKYV